MKRHIDWRQLDRHLAGDASAQDHSVREWAASDPRVERGLAALRRPDSEANAPPPSEWDVEAALARVRGRQPSAEAVDAISTPATGGPRRLAGRTAFAIGALAATLVFVVFEASRVQPRAAVMKAGTSVATQAAERARVRLSDGTEVVLAPRSRLHVSATFGGRTREIEIDGEAYFHVARDRERPFRIAARGTTTEVLGTTFVIRAYAGDSVTQVAVVEGSVAFGASATPSKERAVLAAGDVARLTREGVTVRKAAALDSYTDWVNGRITFRDAPLTEAVARLERWYGVTILIHDSALARRRVDASFGAQAAGVDELLAALAAAVGARVEQHDGARVLIPARRVAR